MKTKTPKLIPILSILTFAITAAAYLVFGKEGIFYALDPDIVYFTNALSWIKAHQIHYIDHPGTPSIFLLSQGLIPLRLYVKLLTQQSFLSWVIENFSFMFIYARLFNSLILSLATYFFLKSVHISTKSHLITLLTWLVISTFSPFFFLGSTISPEATSFLIVSIWIFQYSLFEKYPHGLRLLLLSLTAGLAIANKFSNLFIAPITLALVFQFYSSQKHKKIKFAITNSIVICSGFILGTWPIRSRYPQILSWVGRLATSSGIHGSGSKSIFNLNSYLQSFGSFINLEKNLVIALLLIMFILLIGLISRISHFTKQRSALLLGAGLGFLVFAKYPLSHYQLANLSIIIFILLGSLPRRKLFTLVLILLLIPGFIKNLTRYQSLISSAALKTVSLERYIDSHPSKQATAWEWGRSHDFALLWGRAWSGGVYDQELTMQVPDLFELKTGFKYINTSYHDRLPVFDVCWDQLYIQEVSAKDFLKLHSDRSLTFTAIEGTGNMGVVNSNHCLDK
jgi:hypothetical protein